MAEKKKKILLIDDEEAFGQAVKMNLENTGSYEVRYEKFGLKALDVALEFVPDLILLDFMMRDLGGTAVAEKLHSNSQLKDVPIVFLSAAAPTKSNDRRESTMGGFPSISKPIETDHLIMCIERHLSKK